MIEANELRIGNWMKFKNTDKFYKVNEAGIYDLAQNPSKWNENREPIPLSPEVLEACGFSYLKVKGVSSLDEYNPKEKENTHNWTLKIKREGIYDGRGRLELVKWGDGPKEKIYFSDQWLRVEMKYLHQLQNLYWCLCGKELSYNPTQTTE